MHSEDKATKTVFKNLFGTFILGKNNYGNKVGNSLQISKFGSTYYSILSYW